MKTIMTALVVVFLFTLMMWQHDLPKDRTYNMAYDFLSSGVAPSPTPDPAIVLKEELGKVKAENDKITAYVSRGRERKPKVILDYNKLSAPRYIVELMERMCTKHGFDSIREIYAIVGYESKFDPTAHTTKGEDSRGLLQVNVAVSTHRKAHPNVTKLFDPAYNLEYQLDELSDYYVKGKKKGLKGTDLTMYIAKHGQRPRWSQAIELFIKQYDKEYLNAIIKEARE